MPDRWTIPLDLDGALTLRLGRVFRRAPPSVLRRYRIARAR